jgi:eukaryotic-like serine/threonine-protein kinase
LLLRLHATGLPDEMVRPVACAVILPRQFRRHCCRDPRKQPSIFTAQPSAFVISSDSDDRLLAELIDLPMAERETFLSQMCGNDSVMRQRLEEKLKHLMDSLSVSIPAGDTLSGSSRSVIAHALAAALDVLEKPGTLVDRYELLERIGEGGCGIVYLAEQKHPVRRQVALKLIKLGLDTREFVARFEAERQALAVMEHPNIARVFDAGATEVGRPYFVMELVRGVPITRYCDENNLPLRQRLLLFISVCEAVQHAHQKGVIHRDLKPSNILVIEADPAQSDRNAVPLLLSPSNDVVKGVPKIIDFGIAKAMGAAVDEKTQFTQFHSFIGTPAYSSPEQIEMGGLDVDTRTDIYSLGVLLYELLTSRTPFDSQELVRSGLDAMRKKIRETEPPRPSSRLHTTSHDELHDIALRRGSEPPRLIHRLRGDLDWIVMKCLEKDRTRRYATANGLAADLKRHLNDEPVAARPPSSAYRFRKLVSRNKLKFAAGAAVFAALLLGIVATTWQAVRATSAKREALAAQAREATARTRAESHEFTARQRAYASDMNVALQALRGSNLGRALDLLDRQRPQPGESDLRGWEWRYLWQQTRSDALSILCQKSQIQSLTVSSDGRWLAIGVLRKDGLFVWDMETRQEVAHLAQGNGIRAAFSPVGPLLAYATGGPDAGGEQRLYLWNVATRQGVADFRLGGPCAGLAFSRDGRTLVTSTGLPNERLTLWRVSDGAELDSFPTEQRLGAGTTFAVAHDLSIAAYGSQNQIRVVDLGDDGKERWSSMASRQVVTALAFSRDGTILASAAGLGDSDIRLWDVATGKEIARLNGHTSWVGSLVFWPDSNKLASSSADQTIRTWDLASRTCTDVLRGHRQEVWELALLPDNRTLVSGCKDGSVFLWDTSVVHSRRECFTWSDSIAAWCFAPEGQSVLTVDSEGQVARWAGPDFQDKELLLNLPAHPSPSHATVEQPLQRELFLIPFSSDGRFLARASPGGEISVWDVPRRTLSCTFKPAGKVVVPMCFLNGNSRLVAWSPGDNRLVDWDLAANREAQSWPGPQAPLFGFGLSPSEEEMVVAGDSGAVLVRNLLKKSTTTPNLNLLEPGEIAFSPSGGMLAIASHQGYVRVWDTASWREVATVRGFLNAASSVAFSPDGRRLAATASAKDEALQLWAVDSWEHVFTLPAEGSHFGLAAFSPGGNAIGVLTALGRLYVWRAPSWAEIEKAEGR